MPHIICISQKKNTYNERENLDNDIILDASLKTQKKKILLINKHYECEPGAHVLHGALGVTR